MNVVQMLKKILATHLKVSLNKGKPRDLYLLGIRRDGEKNNLNLQTDVKKKPLPTFKM